MEVEAPELDSERDGERLVEVERVQSHNRDLSKYVRVNAPIVS